MNLNYLKKAWLNAFKYETSIQNKVVKNMNGGGGKQCLNSLGPMSAC